MVFCGGKCKSQARLDGKTAIVTGSNCGIGQFTAMDLYKRGCRVIMACRNTEKAERAKQEIKDKTGDLSNVGELVVEKLDLSSLQSVREFSDKILKRESQINLLINNAGVMMCPKSFTVDGFEMQLATNHLGHFLLTLLLLPRILNSVPARIVTVSSIAHKLVRKIDWDNLNAEKSYSPTDNYGLSKIANIYFTTELARRLEGRNVNTYSLHPGIVDTDISRHTSDVMFPGAQWLYKNVGGIFQKNVEEGAQTTIYCAVDEEVASDSGFYYSDCKAFSPSCLAQKEENAKKMWDASLKMVQLKEDPFTKLDVPPTE